MIRDTIKQLLAGQSPDEPLLLPLIFSLGARVVDLPLQSYLTNPTRIANALLQIHHFLKCDGISCYVDAGLEIEALKQLTGTKNRVIPKPTPTHWEQLKETRVNVAAEVMQRLKSMLQGDVELTTVIQGPFALASHYLATSDEPSTNPELIDLADQLATVIDAIANRYVESGANVLFIYEDVPDPLPHGTFEEWSSVVLPLCNAISFYEALPVLCLSNPEVFSGNQELLESEPWPGVFSLSLPDYEASAETFARAGLGLGLAIPAALFHPGGDVDALLARVQRTTESHQPVLLTTEGDLPPDTDLKQLSKVLEAIRHRCRPML